MTLPQITAFFGWMTLINLVFYSITVIFVIAMKDRLMGLHARMFRMEPAGLPQLYMEYLARYKVAFIVFNLVPYLALRLGLDGG